MALLLCFSMKSQIGIGIPNPDASCVLELASIEKGFLPPRLTTAQRDAITRPALGLTIYNTTKKCLEWYLTTGWYNACGDNGIAIIDSYICTTATTGTMVEGTRVSGVSQTITVNVKTVGSYDISATANGVTFSAKGNLTALGMHDIVLTATGIPANYGSHTFTLNTTPVNCTFSRVTHLTVTGAGGGIWMAYNLGATAPSASMSDQYGGYYQWGRGNDGHGDENSATTSTRSPTDDPGHGLFITGNANWQITVNNNLWQTVKGNNNPCPDGFRVPTSAEFEGEFKAGNVTGVASAFNSILKIPAAGNRERSNKMEFRGSQGRYWTSTVTTHSNYYRIGATSSYIDLAGNRANGLSVRCIKD
ncbi:FISUMP domain-containing protein [Flavobacterium hercynium]|nr:FISUMP domain-containing protein [Flavobacterium hercynium]